MLTIKDIKKATALTLAESGRMFIHPFDNMSIIAGQGTIALDDGINVKKMGDLKANVLHIYHDRNVRDNPIDVSRVELELEPRGAEHAQKVRQALIKAGYVLSNWQRDEHIFHHKDTKDSAPDTGRLKGRHHKSEGRLCRAEALSYMPIARINNISQRYTPTKGCVHFTNFPSIERPEKTG